MSGDIIQINLRKSMMAMVELNRHVKHAYVRIGADGGIDGPGGDVDVKEGRSNSLMHHNVDKNRKNVCNVRTGAEGGVDGPGGDVNVDGRRSSTRIHHNIDKSRKKSQNRSNNGPGGVARAPGGHGGGRGSPIGGGDRQEVDGQGRVRLDGWDRPNPRDRAEIGRKTINEHCISSDRGTMYNNNIITDIDGVDQAEAAHGSDHINLIDGAARLGVGGRGRGRSDVQTGELRHQYHLSKDKNEHNISSRGDIMYNIRDDVDIDGTDQAPVAHGGGRGDLVDAAARLEVGGWGRGRPGSLAGEPWLQYHSNHTYTHTR